MIVSHARRFIFFHNPKCAGTSFRDTLKPYHDDPITFWGPRPSPFFRNDLDHTHLRLWEVQALYPALLAAAETEYRSVIFVRSPYLRFLSALAEHFKKFQPNIPLANLSSHQQGQVIDQFLDRILTIAVITTNWTFIHFSPQIWFLRLGDRVVPRLILPMEAAGDFMERALDYLDLPRSELPHHNPSPFDLGHLLSVPRVSRFVQEFYALDFEFLRASPELARLADRL